MPPKTITQIEHIEHWKQESTIWTSDVDYWLDEIASFQQLLDEAVSRVHDSSGLKRLDHLQNMVLYYGKEVLPGLKSQIYHHLEDLMASSNGSLASMYEGVDTDHAKLARSMGDVHERMREYKQEFVQMRDFLRSIPRAKLNHLVIPTDFSENAGRAVDYALSIFGKGAASVSLLHVLHSPSPSGLGTAHEVKELSDLHRADFLKEKERITRDFPDLVAKIDALYRIGSLSECIQALDKEKEIDLIVMGTRGADEASLLLGSNSSQVARTVQIPLLVVPDEAPLLPPQRIMLASDLEHAAQTKGSRILKCLVDQYQAELHVVHIDSENEVVDSAHERMGLRAMLSEMGLESTELQHVFNEDVIEGINDYVKHHMIDMLCTVTHQESFLGSLFTVSTTQQLVLHSHTPMLVLHSL